MHRFQNLWPYGNWTMLVLLPSTAPRLISVLVGCSEYIMACPIWSFWSSAGQHKLSSCRSLCMMQLSIAVHRLGMNRLVISKLEVPVDWLVQNRFVLYLLKTNLKTGDISLLSSHPRYPKCVFSASRCQNPEDGRQQSRGCQPLAASRYPHSCS